MTEVAVEVLALSNGHWLSFACPDLVAIADDFRAYGLMLANGDEEVAEEWRIRALIGDKAVPDLVAHTFEDDGRLRHSMPCQHHFHMGNLTILNHESMGAALDCLKITLGQWLRVHGYDARFSEEQPFIPSLGPPSGEPPLFTSHPR